MYERDDFSFSLDNFSGRTKLLALPNLLMFPHVMQPLHIVEQEHRNLLKEALADDKMIALSVLEPSRELSKQNEQRVFPFACLAKVVCFQKMQDDGYNVLLIGIQRVRLIESVPNSPPYPEAIVELCDDIYPKELATYDEIQKRFREAFARFFSNPSGTDDLLGKLLDTEVPLGVRTDVLSYMLDLPLQKKKELLAEVNVHRRAEVLLKCLNAIAIDHSIGKSGTTPFPPLFSTN